MDEIKLYTPREIAEVLKISYENALSLIKSGDIDSVKVGRQYRVEKSKLLAFLAGEGKQDENLDVAGIYNNDRPAKGTKLRRRK